MKKYFQALLVSKQVDQDSERKILVGLDISWQLPAKNVKELGRLVLLGHQGLNVKIYFLVKLVSFFMTFVQRVDTYNEKLSILWDSNLGPIFNCTHNGQTDTEA